MKEEARIAKDLPLISNGEKKCFKVIWIRNPDGQKEEVTRLDNRVGELGYTKAKDQDVEYFLERFSLPEDAPTMLIPHGYNPKESSFWTKPSSNDGEWQKQKGPIPARKQALVLVLSTG